MDLKINFLFEGEIKEKATENFFPNFMNKAVFLLILVLADAVIVYFFFTVQSRILQ